jgi:FKBP-type peptidyl-prolyl cis-trans isomerase
MRKSLFFTLLGLGLSFSVFAQCDDCGKVEGFEADYCFVTDLLPGKCVQFSLNADHFYYQAKSKKDPQKVMLAEKMDLAYLVDLSEEKKLKLKAADAFMIAEALKVWQQEAMELRVSQYAEGKYTAEQLNAMPFTQTETGLGIHILEKGSGPLPAKGRAVTVHYRGYLTDGSVFDASYDRGQAFSFPLGMGRVIKGWDQGIAQLPIGTRALLRIPAELGYGARSAGKIPANSTLIFDVFVIDSK